MYATDDSLTPSGSWTYETDGWGLTLLPARTVAAVEEDVLLLSDGSSSIYFIDPCSLAERRELRLTVTDAGTPVVDLNELEVVEGRLWANMWRTDRIAVIDLASGDVLFYVDCSSLEARLPGTRSVEYVHVASYDVSLMPPRSLQTQTRSPVVCVGS
jgi:glutamine cyclotransferase